MKLATLTLLGTTAVFAGTSIYLSLELAKARDALAESAARVAPAPRAEFEPPPHVATESPELATDVIPATAQAPMPATPSNAAPPESPASGRNRFANLTPAEQRQRRIGQETRLRDRFSDMPRELGLDVATADRLFDLLADSQIAMQDSARAYPGDPAAAQVLADSLRRERDAGINALLGPDKAADFLAYEKSIPARMQVGRIEADLTASDVPLRDDQRQAMIAALVEIQEKYPQPERPAGSSARDSQLKFLDWQAEYSKQVQARVEPLLTSGQRARYREAVELQNSRRAGARARAAQALSSSGGQ